MEASEVDGEREGGEAGYRLPGHPFFERVSRRPAEPPVHLGHGGMVVQGGLQCRAENGVQIAPNGCY